MRPIQLVDLHTQYLHIKEQVDQAVLEVIDSTAYIGGKHVKGLSEELSEYLGIKHIIPCANGTDALQIALMSLGLKPGDEVLTPSFTYIATCEVIGLLGLKPVFVEVDETTFTMDPDDLESKITPRSKAIVPVHLYGHCAPMDDIMRIAIEHDLKVVEDTAQAIGAKYTSMSGVVSRAGGIGHIGTTSFFPSKNLGCYGDGGAMFTNDDDLAAEIRMIANHGQSRRYYHDKIGVNSRLDNIQAAVLRIKLQKLDDYERSRQAVAAHYNQKFSDNPSIATPEVAPWSTHVYHQYTIKLNGVNRDELQAYLNEKQIPTNIYYPVPAHLQRGYEQYGFKNGDMPVTESLTTQVLSLPIHTEMDQEQLNHITDSINAFTK